MNRLPTQDLVPVAKAVFNRHWGPLLSLDALSGGRINDSFLVTVDRPPASAHSQRFVLQRINTELFQRHEQLIEQSLRVVTHLRSLPVASPRVPAWQPTTDGEYGVWTEHGLWRVLNFIEGEPLSRAAAELAEARLRAAAAAFARLQDGLATLPEPRLKPNIPYLYRYDLITEAADEHRARMPGLWVERLDRYRDQWLHLTATDGYIHGDCKPDNILFLPESVEPAAVLDLDTVMWGNRWWDFGDLVRSSVWADDRFSPGCYALLLEGFLGGGHAAQARRLRADLDRDAVLDAPMYVAFLLVLRYLNDHFEGDRHFKVERAGDNLIRAEERFQRLTQLMAARSTMAATLDRWLGC
ncbi:MAG: aminoglycoside phosphotransferase family protein [Pseudomonadota bacterium]